MIQVDVGGHPPTHLDPHNCLFQSFQFPKLHHSLLFLAVFRVLNFRSRFEALNDVFLGFWGNMGHRPMLPPKVVVLG